MNLDRSPTKILLIVIFSVTLIFAQNEKKKPNNQNESKIIKSPQALNDKIEFKNESGNPIITITDEGNNAGSLTIPESIPANTANKLYNDGGELKFNGSIIGSGSVNELNDLSDARYIGSSLFLGLDAGANDNGTDKFNVGTGLNSLKSNTSGSGNTAYGTSSLIANTSGSENVGIGFLSLNTNQTGNQNTAVGAYAGLNELGIENISGNVFLGYKAGYNEIVNNKLFINNDESSTPLIWGDFTDGSEELIINGDFHVTGDITTDGSSIGATEINDLSDARYIGSSLFLGLDAGANDNGTDKFNVGTGLNSLKSNTSGSGNTAYGTSSLIANTTGSENVGIGFLSLNTNQTGNQNTAVGAYAGVNELGIENISGNVFLGYKAGYNEIVNNKLFINNNESSTPLIWGDFENDRIVINGNATSNTNNRTFFSNGDAGGTSSWFNDSDRRLKENIKTIGGALEKVKMLRGITFEWKDKKKYSNGKKIGFIAQEVEKVIPQVVDNSNDHYSMQYAPLTALLVEAIKELSNDNQKIKVENKMLKNENNELENRLSRIEKILSKPGYVNSSN